jgi:DNA-binding transcriptional regulator YiaG
MSELLRVLRKIKFTQADLARELSVSPQVVNNWIRRDSIPPEWAIRIAQVTFADERKLCPRFPWPK